MAAYGAGSSITQIVIYGIHNHYVGKGQKGITHAPVALHFPPPPPNFTTPAKPLSNTAVRRMFLHLYTFKNHHIFA